MNKERQINRSEKRSGEIAMGMSYMAAVAYLIYVGLDGAKNPGPMIEKLLTILGGPAVINDKIPGLKGKLGGGSAFTLKQKQELAKIKQELTQSFQNNPQLFEILRRQDLQLKVTDNSIDEIIASFRSYFPDVQKGLTQISNELKQLSVGQERIRDQVSEILSISRQLHALGSTRMEVAESERTKRVEEELSTLKRDEYQLFLQFKKNLRYMADQDVINEFNEEVANPGRRGSNARFLSVMLQEFNRRGFDYSAIGDRNGISLLKIKLIRKRRICLSDKE